MVLIVAFIIFYTLVTVIAELRVALFCFDKEKMSTTTQTSLYEESEYINKHLFCDCVTVHGRWSRK